VSPQCSVVPPSLLGHVLVHFLSFGGPSGVRSVSPPPRMCVPEVPCSVSELRSGWSHCWSDRCGLLGDAVDYRGWWRWLSLGDAVGSGAAFAFNTATPLLCSASNLSAASTIALPKLTAFGFRRVIVARLSRHQEAFSKSPGQGKVPMNWDNVRHASPKLVGAGVGVFVFLNGGISLRGGFDALPVNVALVLVS